MELYLESPLEALVIRYSAILAGYIWTCLALFAAGIGLWRFRLLGSASRSVASSAPKSPSAAVSPAISATLPRSAPTEPGFAVSDCGVHEESRTLTKGRFTAYFLAEEIDGGDKSDGYEWGSYNVGGGGEFLALLDWEWRGDHGVYSFQDWKLINGNVVRLWDGGREGQHRRQR